jgi:hypothetical protein
VELALALEARVPIAIGGIAIKGVPINIVFNFE